MSTDERARLLKRLQNRSIDDTLEELTYLTELFRQKEYYDLNKVVTNELDFLLGAFFSRIISKCSMYYALRGINPSHSEALEFNVMLFSKAAEYKEQIKKSIGV